MTVVAKEDALQMYDDFYRFLSDCGVDAVKTDAQFMLDTLESARDRCDLFTTYLDAWTISSLRHFSIKAISCMSQTPQILFYSQLSQNKPAILVRNSDDFFPDVETSHSWHVFVNANNSLFTQHLNLLPDWDMFQTVHSYSGFHAAARCVSGGPICITDIPGQHDVGLINQMTGRTTRDKTVIFRPNTGKSLDPYVGYDDEVLLKVGTYHGALSSAICGKCAGYQLICMIVKAWLQPGPPLSASSMFLNDPSQSCYPSPDSSGLWRHNTTLFGLMLVV